MFSDAIRIKYAGPREREPIFPRILLQRQPQSVLPARIIFYRLDRRSVLEKIFAADPILDPRSRRYNSFHAKTADAPHELAAPMKIMFVLWRFEIHVRRRNPCKMQACLGFESFNLGPRRFGKCPLEPDHPCACLQSARSFLGWQHHPANRVPST